VCGGVCVSGGVCVVFCVVVCVCVLCFVMVFFVINIMPHYTVIFHTLHNLRFS